jgi:hypothetical protein
VIELVPGVSRNTFRDNDPKAAIADAEYLAKRPSVLQRHNYICQFCGVACVDALEVHHLDCNHANNSEGNLKPADVFCHPVNHIGEASARAKIDQSEAAGAYVQMAYLPDISQADLSHLMRAIGFVLHNGTEEQKAEASALYEQIAGYSNYVEDAWGTSKAALFAIALREAPQASYDARSQSMAGIRVIFTSGLIAKMASKFTKEFASLPISSWKSIFEQRKPIRQ